MWLVIARDGGESINVTASIDGSDSMTHHGTMIKSGLLRRIEAERLRIWLENASDGADTMMSFQTSGLLRLSSGIPSYTDGIFLYFF